jgi:transcriptional regulator with XRE-family HTH domain
VRAGFLHVLYSVHMLKDVVGSEVVQELLRRSGLTKSELSARSGVSRSQLDDYLKGKSQPTLAQLDRLGESAGFRADFVWTADRTPRWARPNPHMDPPQLTVRERAEVLPRVVYVAMAQRRRAPGELRFPPFRTLVKR